MNQTDNDFQELRERFAAYLSRNGYGERIIRISACHGGVSAHLSGIQRPFEGFSYVSDDGGVGWYVSLARRHFESPWVVAGEF